MMAPGFARARRRSRDSRQAFQKFYKDKGKGHLQAIQSPRHTSLKRYSMGTIKLSPTQVHRFHTPAVWTWQTATRVVHTVEQGYALQNGEPVIFEDKKSIKLFTGSLTYARQCFNKARYRVYHSVTCPIEQRNPTQHDWNAAKHVLRYLKGMKDLGIVYKRETRAMGSNSGSHDSLGFLRRELCRRSPRPQVHQRYVFMAGGRTYRMEVEEASFCGLSTTEAEYYALGVACQRSHMAQTNVSRTFYDFRRAPTLYIQTIPGLWLCWITPSFTLDPST